MWAFFCIRALSELAEHCGFGTNKAGHLRAHLISGTHKGVSRKEQLTSGTGGATVTAAGCASENARQKSELGTTSKEGEIPMAKREAEKYASKEHSSVGT